MSEWEEALPAAGGDAVWALSTYHSGSREGGGLPLSGGVQTSPGQLWDIRLGPHECAVCIFGNCFTDWLLSKQSHPGVGSSESQTLNVSSQGWCSMLQLGLKFGEWREGSELPSS